MPDWTGERGSFRNEGEVWVIRWVAQSLPVGIVWSGGQAGDAAAVEVPGSAGAACLHRCGDLDGVMAERAAPAPGTCAGEPVEKGALGPAAARPRIALVHDVVEYDLASDQQPR